MNSDSYHVDDPAKIQGRDEIIPGTRNLGEIRLDRALDALGDTGGRLLLLGAGAGRYARALANARPDLDVFAGDLSRRAISEAISYGGSPLYLVMDAETLPFASGTFDAVVFFDLIEHVPSPETLLAECQRVLRPGCTLHFFVPLEDQPRTLYRALRRNRPIPIHRWKREHVGHIQRFDEERIVEVTRRAGLVVSDVSHSFHLVGQIHDVIDYWQRERSAGGAGLLPVRAVNLITRGAFVLTWRLAYLEDRVYSGPILASGLHLSARKPASPAISQQPDGIDMASAPDRATESSKAVP
ncbi:MAG: class I SAM-dependent methyltransferase [Chloroflexota bacterium]|nr:class I SAM-dependent methyltransferase [Chloroflexota bacterium]